MSPKRRRSPGLRADAARNRERVLAAAEEVFAAEGLAVPIDEVARRAEVGIGTVYRHFPTKEALFIAIVEDKLLRLEAYARELAEESEPADAFFALLDRMVADGARKKDLVAALSAAGHDARTTASGIRSRLRTTVGALLRRAQSAGGVRKQITVDEVFALLGAVLTAAETTKRPAQRLFAVVRDGLRPS